MKNTVQNSLKPGQFKFSGYLGKKIDTYANARLLSQEAWGKIYPETEQAFRNRVDDKLEPGHGLWQGEFWGKHILSALAASEYYEDESILSKLKEASKGLISTQDEDGYIGTYSDSSFLTGDTWNIWCRKYTLWGLVELYQKFKDPFILDSAVKFLNHIITQVGNDKASIIETGNFYGLPSTSILQPVIEMYKITENPSYLDFANHIVDQWGKHPDGIPNIIQMGLENKPIHKWFNDPFRWAKGYEFISCVEGLLELYKINSNSEYLQVVLNIHNQLVEWEQSFLGSISFDDKLMGAKYFKNTFSEICDNIYWNRLNYSLYCLTSEAKYADLFEKTLYNGLLVGMKPDGNWGLRRQRVSHEHIPASPHCYLKHHQCCTTNLPRGFFQAGQIALSADKKGLCIATYAPGKGKIFLADGRRATVEISGDYPFENLVTIKITTSDGKPCALRLRKPSWCQEIDIKHSNKKSPINENKNWVDLESNWKSNEPIQISFGEMTRVEIFDPKAGDNDEEMIKWQCNTWVKRGYFSEDGRGQISTLTNKDPRKQIPAVAIFLGPLALARDIRLGDLDVFSQISNKCDLKRLKLSERTNPPMGIERTWDLDIGENEPIKLCDYPSAGNTWDKKSLFATWIDFKET